MHIGVVQFHPVFGAVARNIAKAVSMMRGHRADLWVLPELFNTGYQFVDRAEVLALSEGTADVTVTTLVQQAAMLGTHICGGWPERSGDHLYNSAFLVGPGGLCGSYRKIHLFDREKELFDPGDRAFPVFPVNGVNVGLMICFDWFFPESARSLALEGAQVILHPSNLVLPHAPDAMKTRALENQVFTVTANRIGMENRLGDKGLTFIGSSTIWSPWGERLARADSNTEQVLLVEIDASRALNKAVTKRNDVWRDRRPEFYRT